MVVRMIAKVNLDTMSSTPLYPPENQSEERVALLTGIVQLVQTALQSSGEHSAERVVNYMKSDKGVVGYMQVSGELYICDAENEKEAANVMTTIRENPSSDTGEITKLLEKQLRKRGREISSLWG